MSKSVIVFGYGRMGRAATHFLLKNGYQVVAVDQKISWRQPLNNLVYIEAKSIDTLKYVLSLYQPHLAVSTLPYTANIELASLCLQSGVPYIDLGGKVENTKAIREMSKDYPDVPVFTDTGLAPGLINILTEYLVGKTPGSHSVLSAVGGIPTEQCDDPFNYYCTWSMEGLVNEYLDDCEILSSGYVLKGIPLKGLEFIHLDKINKKVEAFNTSGASAHSVHRMQEMGVRNYHYKTIRYIGHRNLVEAILFNGNSNDLVSIFTRLSDTAPCKTDQVVGLVRIQDKDDKELAKQEFLIKGDNEFSAMQRATAGPLAVIASMMVDGYILPKGYITYSDIVKHMGYFQWKLKDLCQISI